MKTIRISRSEHKSQGCLFLDFEYNEEFISIIRQVTGATFSRSRRLWHVPDTGDMQGKLLTQFKGKAWLDYSELKSVQWS